MSPRKGNSTRRLLLRTAGMGCAAALAGMLGCATKSQPPSGSPGPTGSPGRSEKGKKPVTVIRPLGVNVDPVKLWEGKDHPEWSLSSDWPEGSCMIISIKDDPLEPGEDPGGPCKKVIRRGVPKHGTGSPEGRRYKYTVTVKVPNKPPEILDPELEVDK